MVEPPKSARVEELDPDFAERLTLLLGRLEDAGTPFAVIEGRRSTERQQWLYGSGRALAPYAHPGPWLTNCDGIVKRSRHQDGRAADLWPLNPAGRVFCPSGASWWETLAREAEAVGLVAGYRWPWRDSDHVEMPS